MNKWKESFFYKFPTGMLLLLSVYIAGISLVTMGNQKERMNGGCCPIFLILPGGVLLFALILYVAKKIKDSKHDFLFGVSGFFIILFVQLFIVLCVAKIYPITDSFRTLDEAAAMPLQNGLLDNSEGYYAHYTNNYLFTILMYYAFFIARWLGIPYVSFATALNIFAIDLAILFGYFIVKQLFGRKGANRYLFVTMLSPTTYVFVYYTYTNTFSMPFILGIILCGLKKGIPSKVGFIVLSIIGYDVRPTTVFATIAILVYWAVNVNKSHINKKNILTLGCLLLMGGMLLFTEKSFIKAHLVNPHNTKGFPMTHWIMMGLHDTGTYNPGDYKLTASKEGKEKKIAANLQVIQKRVKKLGITGVAKIYLIKVGRDWAVGTDDFQVHNNSDANFSRFYESIFGTNNTWLLLYCQMFRCVTFVFIIAMLIQMLFSSEGIEQRIVFIMALLGIILFLMMWETSKKYSICYTPILMIMMQCGIDDVCTWMERLNTEYLYKYLKPGRLKRYAVIGGGFIGLCMVVIVVMRKPFPLEQKPYEKKIIFRAPSTRYFSMDKLKEKDICQILDIKKKFEIIKLYAKKGKAKGDGCGVLNVRLLDENMRVVEEKEFTNKEVKRKGGYLVLDQLSCSPGKYHVVIRTNGDCSYANISYEEGKILERYENSQLYFGKKKMGTSALSVSVYDLYS